jgi:putative hydrolase of the HAD superfamily
MIEIKNILDVEQYLDNVDGVIFDLDDTLYSEKEYVRSGYKAVASLFPEVPNMEKKLWYVFERGGRAIDEVLKTEGLLEFKESAVKEYRSHKPSINLYAGVDKLLDRLKGMGKKIGIITDGRPEGQRAKLEALHLEVDEIIVTDELGGIEFRKPNVMAFMHMQQRMGIEFSKMVYIGDNPQKDFLAPLKLGMQCIYFKNKDGLY